jgi:hypothetical protein
VEGLQEKNLSDTIVVKDNLKSTNMVKLVPTMTRDERTTGANFQANMVIK